jgi:hypothetical protein
LIDRDSEATEANEPVSPAKKSKASMMIKINMTHYIKNQVIYVDLKNKNLFISKYS